MSARSHAERVLADLLRAGAIPAIAGGRLTIDAPAGTMTAERREALAGCLPELRALVAERWRSREQCVARRPCRVMSPCAKPKDGRPCLIPAICCACGRALTDGRRYLCEECARQPASAQSGR